MIYQITEAQRQQLLDALQSLFNGGGVAVWKLGGSHAPTLALEMLQSLAPVDDHIGNVNKMVEPVAWMWKFANDDGAAFSTKEPTLSIREGVNYIPLYTHTLRELSDAEIDEIYEEVDGYQSKIAFARAVLKAAR